MTTIINGSSPSITFSDGSAQTSATRPFQNRIINGAMVVSQYNGTSSASLDNTKNQYYIDRFAIQNDAGVAVFSFQQVTTAPTGFNNSLKITVTTVNGSLSATNKATIYQPIEGFNFADLGWGTASAKTITISFWVQSSVIGTFGGALNNESQNRSYPFTYAINVANTWEYKTVTIAGDTTGTWTGATNAIGVYVNFSLGAGTTRSGTAGAWNSNWNTSATGATNLLANSAATLFLTGVQLEVGSTATSFDYRPYGTELMLCQRYFVRLINGNGQELGSGWNYNSTQVSGLLYAPVSMRATPSIISSSGSNYYIFYRDNVGDNFNSITIENSNATNNVVSYYNDSQISGTGGQCGLVRSGNASASVALSSEL